MPLPPDPTPAWFHRLPVFRPQPDRRVVIVDNQAISYYLLDRRRDPPELIFPFEDQRVVIRMGRQVIDEALHSTGVVDSGMEPDRRGRPRRVAPEILGPGLSPEMNKTMWEGISALQARDKVMLSGLTQMTAFERNVYGRLSLALHNAGVSEEDSKVAADGLVSRTPIFSLDNRFRNAAESAVTRARVDDLLEEVGLATFAQTLFVG